MPDEYETVVLRVQAVDGPMEVTVGHAREGHIHEVWVQWIGDRDPVQRRHYLQSDEADYWYKWWVGQFEGMGFSRVEEPASAA